jgi:hypothetical protein
MPSPPGPLSHDRERGRKLPSLPNSLSHDRRGGVGFLPPLPTKWERGAGGVRVLHKSLVIERPRRPWLVLRFAQLQELRRDLEVFVLSDLQVEW